MRFIAVCFISVIIILLLAVGISAAQGKEPVTTNPRAQERGEFRPNEWLRQLASDDDLETRLEAVKGLASLPKTPAEAVPGLLGMARDELNAALQSPPLSDMGRPTARIPLVGDEVSLERVKANVPDYIDKTFVLCGVVTLSDHYNYGYWGAEATHYALQFVPLDANGVRGGSERAVLYLIRERGRQLEEQIVRLAERGITGAVVRVRASIIGYRHKTPESWRHMELVDWQLLNPEAGTWGPWAFAGFDLCFAAIKNAGEGAVGPSIDLIAAAPRDPEGVDGMMKTAAVRVLTETVAGRAADFDRVSKAIHEAQQTAETPQARGRLEVALASVEAAARKR